MNIHTFYRIFPYGTSFIGNFIQELSAHKYADSVTGLICCASAFKSEFRTSIFQLRAWPRPQYFPEQLGWRRGQDVKKKKKGTHMGKRWHGTARQSTAEHHCSEGLWSTTVLLNRCAWQPKGRSNTS